MGGLDKEGFAFQVFAVVDEEIVEEFARVVEGEPEGVGFVGDDDEAGEGVVDGDVRWWFSGGGGGWFVVVGAERRWFGWFGGFKLR